MSFIYDDIDLLRKLLKLGEGPQQQVDINKQNLIRLITRLMESYPQSSVTTQESNMAINPNKLAEIQPFNSGYISFSNIEHFLESFTKFLPNNANVANNANIIRQNIEFAKRLLQHPSDSIELDDVSNFIAMASNPIPLLDKLQKIILDTTNLYRECIIRLSGKIDTRAMSQNIESAKANLNTFTQFRFSINQKGK